MTFEQALQSSPLMLMEGAIIERLRYAQPDLIHPRLAISLLPHSENGRKTLTGLCHEYIAVARVAGLPMVLSTPTWRASRDRCKGIEANLNSAGVEFMQNLKQEYSNLFIGGQIGCKNDCYTPKEALSTVEAVEYHSWQIERLTRADFLYGVTLPEINEALGLAQAMAATNRPYIISFVIGPDGLILDGTPLEKAIHKIDSETDRPPIGYGVNCCYPSFLQAASLSGETAGRLLSIQANASSLSHTELEVMDSVQADPVDDWGDRMLDIHRTYGLKILGGCCGTNAEHLRYLTI